MRHVHNKINQMGNRLCVVKSISQWRDIYFDLYFRSMALSTASASGRLGSFTASYVIWLVSKVRCLVNFELVKVTKHLAIDQQLYEEQSRGIT